MVAINPLSSAPVDYYALWEAYRAGVQPIYPDEAKSSHDTREPVHIPKGIGLVFEKDTIGGHTNWAMESIVSKYSSPSRVNAAVAADPALESFVKNRRIMAHLGPVSLYLY